MKPAPVLFADVSFTGGDATLALEPFQTIPPAWPQVLDADDDSVVWLWSTTQGTTCSVILGLRTSGSAGDWYVVETR